MRMRVPEWLTSLVAGLIAAVGVTACDSNSQPPAAAPTASSAAAVVLGEEITATDSDEVRQIILDRLFANYRQEHDIEATDAEIERFVQALKRGEADDPALGRRG